MRILLDQNVPRKLTPCLERHDVETAHSRGWSALGNGDLIAAAEADGFEVLITADQNLTYQQNLRGRTIALVVLDTNRRPAIRPHLAQILAAVESAVNGSFNSVACL